MPEPRWYVGLDLAWGPRNQSGLAVLSADGDLVDVRAVHTDDEIIEQLTPLVTDGAMVAIDAPIVVENETGGRNCERQITAAFGRFHAGAYLSNRSQPAFADGGRARFLTKALALDIDPASTASRRAIEVYPHPATVALFDLDLTLKYKSRNRDIPARRAAMAELIGHLESLADHDPPMRVAGNRQWQQARADVAKAGRHVELGRAEDPVDAVLCAYIGMLAVRRPEAVTTYGDVGGGYIVTPTLPPDRGRTNRSQKETVMEPVSIPSLSKVALVVVDAQQGFDDAAFWGTRNNPACDDNIAALVDAWSSEGRPLVYVQHASENPSSPLHPDSPGHQLKDYLAPTPDLLVTKSVNSSFHGSPDLDAWLRSEGVEGLVVCGITTNHCCETTARVGGNLGHRVLFALDATHTFDRVGPDGRTVPADTLAQVTATNLHGEFAEVVSAAGLLGGAQRAPSDRQ